MVFACVFSKILGPAMITSYYQKSEQLECKCFTRLVTLNIETRVHIILLHDLQIITPQLAAPQLPPPLHAEPQQQPERPEPSHRSPGSWAEPRSAPPLAR